MMQYKEKLILLAKFVVVISIAAMLFYVTFEPHYKAMPQHVDSWITISYTDHLLDTGKLSFTTNPFVPSKVEHVFGAHVYLAAITSITGLDLVTLSQLVPPLIFVILGFLNYALAKRFFKSTLVALLAMAFTLLTLSNITMLGPFYLVNMAFASVLFLTFFYLLILEKLPFAILLMACLPLTHISTTVFAAFVSLVFFLFNRRHLRNMLYLFAAGSVVILVVLKTIKSVYLKGYFLKFLLFESGKARPYFSYSQMILAPFLVLVLVGLFLMIESEKSARKYLVPPFLFLVIDLLLVWRYDAGFLLRYRRIIYYLFLLTPLFVSYGLYGACKEIVALSSRLFNKIHALKRLRLHIPPTVSCSVLILVSLFFLLPMAFNLNLDTHLSRTWVDKGEHELFTQFGVDHPKAYVLAESLESFALPYYDLRPIQLSPGHSLFWLANREFNVINRAYWARDSKGLAGFFENRRGKFDYKYIYYYKGFKSKEFKKVYSVRNYNIYEYIGNKTI